ncbi:hypothetical protein L1887_42179 [Cichorium endivia]|nr:hypothetical protein L1887_42179 [Cichorium endivia]
MARRMEFQRRLDWTAAGIGCLDTRSRVESSRARLAKMLLLRLTGPFYSAPQRDLASLAWTWTEAMGVQGRGAIRSGEGEGVRLSRAKENAIHPYLAPSSITGRMKDRIIHCQRVRSLPLRS